jgi:hypothetical protein
MEKKRKRKKGYGTVTHYNEKALPVIIKLVQQRMSEEEAALKSES